MTTMIPIPLNLDDLNKEYMQKILAEYDKEIIVSEVKAERGTAPGDNFSSDMYRVYVKGKKGKEDYDESFMIKVASSDGSRGNIQLKTPMFPTEMEAYSKTFPEMKKLAGDITLPFAECVYTGRDDVAAAIVLKDLKPQGYVMAKEKFGQTEDEWKAVMIAYAKLHAFGYKLKFDANAPVEEEFSKFCINVIEENKDKLIGMIQAGHNSMVTIASKMPQYRHKIKSLEEKVYMLDRMFDNFKPETSRLATMCHGDTNSNNMMFKLDPITNRVVDCKLVDFEGLILGFPLRDIVQYIYSNVSPELRKMQLNNMLHIYHENFVKYIKYLNVHQLTEEDLSWEKFYSDFKDFLLKAGFYLCLIMIPFIILIILSPSALLGGDFFENATSALKDLDTKDPSEYSFLTEKISATMDEMIEYGFI